MTSRLLSRPQVYNLFQAIALLERSVASAKPLGTGNGTGEALRLSGHASLAFQASDVRAITSTPAGAGPARYVLSTPVMTLAGAGGPLPLAYSEVVWSRQAARDHAARDFLDIFNHRFLSFLYRSRRKHALGLSFAGPLETGLAATLGALANLGYERRPCGPHGQRLWMRHAGLLAATTRSMTGLLALLGDRLGLKVRGEQFIGGWRALDPRDYSRLGGSAGSAASLTGTRVLGRRAWDQAAGIAISFLDLEPSRLESLAPGGRDHELAVWLVGAYLRREIRVIFVLHGVSGGAGRKLGGAGGPRLGWTSQLISGASAVVPVCLRVAARKAPSV